MSRPAGDKGFSLIELLLVLAILGIISVIAVPAFLGQRRRARLIGDARSNAAVLRMLLEQRRSDTGIYGAPGTYTWTATGTTPAASVNIAPGFWIKGNSRMDFSVTVTGTGLTYNLAVRDADIAGSPVAWVADERSNGHISSTYNY